MKSRFVAFLLHISLSIIVAFIAILVVFYIWYPSPLHHAFSVLDILFLLLAVDVTIGPALTFIVYNPQKKSLTFDLSIIVVLQVIALGYGLQTIYQGRPAYIVFSQDRFEAVRTLDINVESKKTALANNNSLANTSFFKPLWVAAVPPKNKKRATEILFSSLNGGDDLPQLPELYIPLTNAKLQILKKSKSLQELNKLYNNTDASKTVKKQLSTYYKNKVKWLPLHGPAKNMIVLVSAETADVIQVIDINPYP